MEIALIIKLLDSVILIPYFNGMHKAALFLVPTQKLGSEGNF